MSIRLRVILIIVLTNLLIILFSIFTGAMLVSRNIKSSQEADMQVVADIADYFISNEIELLHLRASDSAKELMMTDEEEWASVLENISITYPEFIGAAVFDIELGRVAAAGDAPAPEDAMKLTHVAQALNGMKSLKTTYFTEDGRVVFYVAVPLPSNEGRILAVTVPGTFFREKLVDFVIWETGHVFMVDTEGTFVSNPREHWVFERNNIPQMAIEDKGFEALAATAEKMTRGESGIGYYTVYDVPRVCAYKPVSGSEDGWSLGTVAPLPESPFRSINTGLIAAGVSGLLLGIIAAVIGSVFIKKPFETAQALKEESERNSKYKSQFLANMSHEMRTPLTSVIGLTELTLRTVQLDDETHGNLVKVYRAGETLLGLINDILDISKIEANRFELNPCEYDFPSMLNDTITQSLLYIGEKPVEFTLDITEDLPRSLYGDELRTKQLLNNLLSNAFKFTKEGTVSLTVRCEKDGDSVWMTARVSDTGTGIKPQDFEKLFTLYANMDKENKVYDSTRRIEGTGLGLSICKRISEMMDGTITVESEYGKGSVFTVKLRQGYIDDSVIGANVVESLKKFHYSIDKFRVGEKSRVNLSYARVLVVDDNTANLDVAKGLMSLYGMKVDCVTGGRQAIDAIQSERVIYNAVFMDHMMPEIDGIEATRLIREINTEYAKNIPIIALTANAVIGNKEMFLSKGFQAFIAKPIDLSSLDTVLRQFVRDKDAEALLSERTIVVTEDGGGDIGIQNINIQGIDINRGIAYFGNNAGKYMKILASYARNIRSLFDKIKEVNPAKLDEYAVTVHGIKGASYGIFAQQIGEEAQALENAAKNGDFETVKAGNSKFIDNVLRLISDIENALSETDVLQKSTKSFPDKEILERFRAACESFDIDEMDAAMDEIEKWQYDSDDGLSEWLREKLDNGEYKLIKEKLISLLTVKGEGI